MKYLPDLYKLTALTARASEKNRSTAPGTSPTTTTLSSRRDLTDHGTRYFIVGKIPCGDDRGRSYCLCAR